MLPLLGQHLERWKDNLFSQRPIPNEAGLSSNPQSMAYALSHTKSGYIYTAIPDAQNFRQKLQALAVIKIQISIHEKKALSELCQTITVGHCELR